MHAFVKTHFLGFWCVHSFLTPTPTCFYHYQPAKTPHPSSCIIRTTSLMRSIRPKTTTTTTDISTATDSKTEDPLEILPQLYTYQKTRQKRHPQTTLTRSRKPRYYWQDSDNLRTELEIFWEELDVPIQKINRDQAPPIPSEYLLNFFNRNDLRWGIATMGGRVNVSHLLGGAKVIPGRWKDAKKTKEVEYLLPRMEEYRKQGLTRKMSRENMNVQNRQSIIRTQQSHGNQQQERKNTTEAHMNGNTTTNLTLMALVASSAPINSTVRQPPKEFWSKEKAVKELYQYLDNYRKYKQRPAVWMPQLAELSHEGYSKLFNAASRFSKLPCVSTFIQNEDDVIHSVAGLVPFGEWRFFESQLQLFVELQHYLRLYHNGSEDFFPDPTAVSMHGHKQLYELIRIHGGKILLAQKLDMKFQWDVNPNPNSHLSWGSFTLDFAIQLLYFIRSQYLSLSPPLSSSFISMPSEKDLLCCGHGDLARQVIRYGGYENVARRLGYFDGKSQRMEEMRFRGAKLLWKKRHNIGVLSGASTRLKKENNSGQKRKGLAWDLDLVVNELHAYVKVNMTKRSQLPIVMPSLNQLVDDGRADLSHAISKFGGKKHICSMGGLIPAEEWKAFEVFTELLLELSRYANAHNQYEECLIPTTTQATSANFHRLSSLIRSHGGRTRLSKRLDDPSQTDLQAYCEICSFTRCNMMASLPPLSPPAIIMPTKNQMLEKGLVDLVQFIESKGGYEIIARRLGVVFVTSDVS